MSWISALDRLLVRFASVLFSVLQYPQVAVVRIDFNR